MAGAFAPMPAPDRKAAEAAEREAAEREAARRKAADDDAYWQQRRAAEREAAERRAAAESEAAERRAAAEIEARARTATQQAADLALSRRLVQARNTATAVLEADAAFTKAALSRLPAYDLPFFDEQAQIDREPYLERMMTAAGRGLLDAFTDLFHADALWERLAHNEQGLRRSCGTGPDAVRARMALAELLTHHIPEMLLELGYQPPPPAEDWTDIVQNSMQVVVTAGPDDAAVATNADRARQELAWFNERLRVLVEEAERAHAAAEANPAPRSRLPSLRAAVSAARNKAVPAALAAGAVAAVGAAAAGPAGMGIALLSGSAASLLGTATGAAATALIAERGPQAMELSAAQLVRTDLDALDACIELMRSATQATKERISFIIRRGVFQILQDAAACSVPERDFLWQWSKNFLQQLDFDQLAADHAHKLVRNVRQSLS